MYNKIFSKYASKNQQQETHVPKIFVRNEEIKREHKVQTVGIILDGTASWLGNVKYANE